MHSVSTMIDALRIELRVESHRRAFAVKPGEVRTLLSQPFAALVVAGIDNNRYRLLGSTIPRDCSQCYNGSKLHCTAVLPFFSEPLEDLWGHAFGEDKLNRRRLAKTKFR